MQITGGNYKRWHESLPLFARGVASGAFGYPSWVLAAALLCGSVLFFFADYAVTGVKAIERPPDFSPAFLTRTLLIALFALAFVVYAGRAPAETGREGVADGIRFGIGRGREVTISDGLIMWGMLVLALLTTGLFVYDPVLFWKLGGEDNITEMLSYLFAGLAGAVFIHLFFLTRGNDLFLKVGLLTLSAIFLLIALEEVSWYQRVFRIGAPELFRGNLQNETNLHNFASNEVENAYYYAAFLFLVLIPFIHDQTRLFRGYGTITFFVPSRKILLGSAGMVSLNYDMWNYSTIQFAYFTTLFILMYYLFRSRQTPEEFTEAERYLLPVLLPALIVIQWVFLACGDNVVRFWDVTEYKELLIPLGFFIYTLEVATKVIKMVSAKLTLLLAGVTMFCIIMRCIQKLNTAILG